MKIKVSSFHCQNILFSLLFPILNFYTATLLFASPKEIYWEKPKIFKSLGGHKSTNNQKFFGDLLKISLVGHGYAKKVGYLLENLGFKPFRPLDPIMKESFSKHVKSKVLIQN